MTEQKQFPTSQHQTNAKIQSIQRLEAQMGQMARELGERKKGEFTAQTIPNLGGHQQLKVVTTFRNDKIIGTKETAQASLDEASTSKVSDKEKVNAPPFPQRLVKPKKEKKLLDIFETLRKVEINIPLLDVIQQIPAYAKFLKNCFTHKRKFQEYETVALTEEVSVVLLRKLPRKLKDLGSFTIPCMIGDELFECALLDLRAGVNMLPYTVYEMLGLGELQPNSITLQLANRSIKRPRDILEDVLVKVYQFVLLDDFIVLDIEECLMPLPLHIILGRPFMKTADAKICVKRAIVSMKVNGEKIEFKIFDVLKLLQDNLECFNVCIIQGVVEKVFQVHHVDPLEATLTHSFIRQDIEPDLEDVTDDIIKAVHLLETSLPYLSKYIPPFETLVPINTTLVPSTVQTPNLELKQLLEHLTYVYLGENQTLSVIVAANLSLGEEEKLLRVLRETKITLGWTIADIKEISLAKCMH